MILKKSRTNGGLRAVTTAGAPAHTRLMQSSLQVLDLILGCDQILYCEAQAARAGVWLATLEYEWESRGYLSVSFFVAYDTARNKICLPLIPELRNGIELGSEGH